MTPEANSRPLAGQNILVSSRGLACELSEPLDLARAAGMEVVLLPEGGDFSPETFQAALARAAGWVAGLKPVDAALLDRAPKLKVIAKFGVGYDNIDVAAASARGIAVATAPGTNHEAVADMAYGLLLALVRQIPAADQAVRAGSWRRYVGPGLPGRTLGILGVGRIGKAVARRAPGFGLHLLGCDPVWPAELAAELEMERVDFPTLLRRSDFLTLHVPLKDDTRGLLNQATIAAMKRGAYLINTSRGGVVEEKAVLAALASGQLRGYATDVFEQEPPATDSPLLNVPGVILTPHTGAYTVDALRLTGESVVKSIMAVLAGEHPATVINPEIWS